MNDTVSPVVTSVLLATLLKAAMIKAKLIELVPGDPSAARLVDVK
ncbi:hypothetical protein [Actinokineospora iranica]|uniref:Uncharacterized protein n=1 Tax=Actinokineospora iranica TaxID=1271860 RepID=A0A1G6QZC1_9PSEU|nr:hypothetical protein [Actinokineospora iranica]SDC97543.1 hypothetical protein SAMN05216174_10647 [Actinokineospora iranica]